MTYVIEGIDPVPYRAMRLLSDEQLAERGIHRQRVVHYPGCPCRVTLEEVPSGESVLLLNHVSRDGLTPYAASHAIFIREGDHAPARFVDEVPPVMLSRILSLRGFDAAGMIVDASLAQPGEADAALRSLFANKMVLEVDVHNAIRGCYSARARRTL